ncbi:hypothetical protein DNTS_028570 [Danionella cerebrum]|uniref:SANT domain-containing protein n=1 Tax=Danionella cerebrum TaxID=2873325 RepID=A0A553QW70_9TELE|nr:hypothetical protein DNTS_028570 [Danionella translucida]
MAEHSSPEHGPLSFTSMFRSQTEGQRSIHELYQHESRYEGSNLYEIPCDDRPFNTLNGEDQSRNGAYWGNGFFSGSMGLNQNKEHSGVYEPDWTSQQEGVERWAAGLQQQKLDSFSEAFCGRGISRMLSGGDQRRFSNSTPPSRALSFPLVLSPPPTPLPPQTLSPPKRSPQLLPGQVLSQSQVRTDVPMQFFPTLPASSTGRFNPPSWLQPHGDQDDRVELPQELLQESSSSVVYSEHGGPLMKQINSMHKDISPETFSLASPQFHPPQSVQQQLGHEPGTSVDHLSQMMQSGHSFGPYLHLSSLHIQALGTREESDFGCALSSSPGSLDKPLGCSNKQARGIKVSCSLHTGASFSSVIQLSRELMENWEENIPHYTPPPMLNPKRSGTGLFFNLPSSIIVENRALWTDGRKGSDSQGYINTGPEYQAELPDLISVEGRHTEELVREELLWKPWAELEENETLLQQVENLLDLSTSTVVSGNSANLELALHSLYSCQGDILAALEMMMFTSTAPSETYHYSGTETWTLSEQRRFHKAFAIYGKDFSFIHKMVRTKQVSECIEFYYHSKKLSEKIKKQTKSLAAILSSSPQVSPIPQLLADQVHFKTLINTPQLPTSFPCKQCGKMFYKIKSRNAHMKIHRQQHDDWKEKLHIQPNQHHNYNLSRLPAHHNQPTLTQSHHQNHILTQNLIHNLVQSQAFLQSTKTQTTNFTSNHVPTQSSEIVPKLSPSSFHSWGSQSNGETNGLCYNKISVVNGVHLTIQDDISKPWG